MVDPRAILAAAEEVDGNRIDLATQDAPPNGSLDPHLTQQILSNLLTNAILASPSGERGDATLALKAGALVIRIPDCGEAVPEQGRDQIFEPFYTTRTRGTALGRAADRRIVTLHGGTITATDHPEGGSVFQVTLPLA